MNRPEQPLDDPTLAHPGTTVRSDEENLRRTLRLTRVMLGLADDGDRDHRDPACAILFGTVRDMAYKLRRAAEDELERHRREPRRS